MKIRQLVIRYRHKLRVTEIVVLKSTQKGLPAPDSDASYNCGFSKGKWPTTFQENLTVSAASTPGGAVLFCWVMKNIPIIYAEYLSIHVRK